MVDNLCLLTDSYKVSHWKQYPPGTTGVYSYLTSRGGRYPYAVWFGLQERLLHYFAHPVTAENVKEAEALFAQHMGPGLFNTAGWLHIVQAHGGILPLRVKGLPEGSHVPAQVPLMTIESTCPKCAWLVNYMETILMQVWYPTTVCTQSHFIKKLIGQYLQTTMDGDWQAALQFKLHDFGFRGVSSVESAGIGGLAHLVNFSGTDTVAAFQTAKRFYGVEHMLGFSVPAAEHSTITAWGRLNEAKAFGNMLDQFPTGIVAVVSDSYDIYNACRYIWGEQLKDRVLARDGCVVVRPDSGTPVIVVEKCIEILGEKFGYTVNSKGFKVLPPQIRVIQGDGVNYHSISDILLALYNRRWSTENVTFGMGGALLQQVNRDTLKMALKCSAVQIDGGPWQPVRKDPVTDNGKASAAGRFKVVKDGDRLVMKAETEAGEDLLGVRYEDGRFTTDIFENIRARANG